MKKPIKSVLKEWGVLAVVLTVFIGVVGATESPLWERVEQYNSGRQWAVYNPFTGLATLFNAQNQPVKQVSVSLGGGVEQLVQLGPKRVPGSRLNRETETNGYAQRAEMRSVAGTEVGGFWVPQSVSVIPTGVVVSGNLTDYVNTTQNVVEWALPTGDSDVIAIEVLQQVSGNVWNVVGDLTPTATQLVLDNVSGNFVVRQITERGLFVDSDGETSNGVAGDSTLYKTIIIDLEAPEFVTGAAMQVLAHPQGGELVQFDFVSSEVAELYFSVVIPNQVGDDGSDGDEGSVGDGDVATSSVVFVSQMSVGTGNTTFVWGGEGSDGARRDGDYVMELVLVDRAGNRSDVVTRNVRFDNIPPSITVDDARSRYVISPNDDGVQDAAVFDVAISEPATLRLDVRHVLTGVTASVAQLVPSVSARVSANSMVFDGYPDGQYVAMLVATDAKGLVGTWSTELIVDRVAPTVPTATQWVIAGAPLAGSVPYAGDGVSASVAVGDGEIALEVSSGNGVLRFVGGALEDTVASGDVGVLWVSDAAGNRSSQNVVVVVDGSAPVLDSQSLGDTLYVGQTASFSYTATDAGGASIYLDLFLHLGDARRVPLLTDVTPGMEIDIAPRIRSAVPDIQDGTYSFEMVLRDSRGNRHVELQSVALTYSGRPLFSGLSVGFSPYSLGTQLANPVRFDVLGENTELKLSVLSSDGTYIGDATVSENFSVGSGAINWSGFAGSSRVSAGSYYLRLSAERDGGNYSQTVGIQVVNEALISVSSERDYYIFTPDGDAVNDILSTLLYVQGVGVVTGDVSIRNSVGSVVKQLLIGADLSAITPLEWDGRDDESVMRSEGQYVVHVDARDSQGRVANYDVPVILLTSPITLTATLSPDVTSFNDDGITDEMALDFTIEYPSVLANLDTYENRADIAVKISQGGIALREDVLQLTTHYSTTYRGIDVPGLSDGEFIVELSGEGSDRVPVQTVVLNRINDEVAPVISGAINPASEAWTSANTLWDVQVNTVDNNFSHLDYSVWRDGGLMVATRSVFESRVSLRDAMAPTLVSGIYTLRFTVTDTAGNTSVPGTARVKLDVTQPTLLSFNLIDSYRNATESTTQTFQDYTEEHSGVDYYLYRIDGGTWIPFNAGDELPLTSYEEGQHTLDIRAMDRAGNVSEASFSNGFIIDRTRPELPGLVFTRPVINLNRDDQLVVAQATDAGTSLFSHYEWRVNGGQWRQLVGAHQLEFNRSNASLFDGDGSMNTIEVRAYDNAGNYSVDQSVVFQIDNTRPVVSGIQGLDLQGLITYINLDRNPTMAVPVASDANNGSGAREFNYTVTLESQQGGVVASGSVVASQNSGQFGVNSDLLPVDGRYTISVVATDYADNVSDLYTVSIVQDRLPPEYTNHVHEKRKIRVAVAPDITNTDTIWKYSISDQFDDSMASEEGILFGEDESIGQQGILIHGVADAPIEGFGGSNEGRKIRWDGWIEAAGQADQMAPEGFYVVELWAIDKAGNMASTASIVELVDDVMLTDQFHDAQNVSIITDGGRAEISFGKTSTRVEGRAYGLPFDEDRDEDEEWSQQYTFPIDIPQSIVYSPSPLLPSNQLHKAPFRYEYFDQDRSDGVFDPGSRSYYGSTAPPNSEFWRVFNTELTYTHLNQISTNGSTSGTQIWAMDKSSSASDGLPGMKLLVKPGYYTQNSTISVETSDTYMYYQGAFSFYYYRDGYKKYEVDLSSLDVDHSELISPYSFNDDDEPDFRGRHHSRYFFKSYGGIQPLYNAQNASGNITQENGQVYYSFTRDGGAHRFKLTDIRHGDIGALYRLENGRHAWFGAGDTVPQSAIHIQTVTLDNPVAYFVPNQLSIDPDSGVAFMVNKGNPRKRQIVYQYLKANQLYTGTHQQPHFNSIQLGELDSDFILTSPKSDAGDIPEITSARPELKWQVDVAKLTTNSSFRVEMWKSIAYGDTTDTEALPTFDYTTNPLDDDYQRMDVLAGTYQVSGNVVSFTPDQYNSISQTDVGETYRWQVRADWNGSGDFSNFTTTSELFSVNAPLAILAPINYPNPFKRTTTIRYKLTKNASHVTIRIFNVAGKVVRTIKNAPTSASGGYNEYHDVVWDGKNGIGLEVNNGVYIYKIFAVDSGGRKVDARGKMVKLR